MNVKADKMRYQANKSGYALILLGMAISIVALFRIITPVTVIPDFSIALEIIVNIMLMLTTFLAAERCKFYQKTWAIVSFVIAGTHVLRIFYVPTQLLSQGQITTSQFMIIVLLLIASATSIIGGGLITWSKFHRLHQHLKEIGE